jgi:hypothetical protein
VTGEPEFCKHIEDVVMGSPGAVDILARRRAAALAAAKRRSSALAEASLTSLNRGA